LPVICTASAAHGMEKITETRPGGCLESQLKSTSCLIGERFARKLLVHRGSTFPVPDAGWLVRYRFRTPADLYRHLQLGNGFLVQERVPRHRVSRAIVEVSFVEGASTLLLHGQVGSRSQGGAMIEVPLPRTTVRWMGEGDGPRRDGRR